MINIFCYLKKNPIKCDYRISYDIERSPIGHLQALYGHNLKCFDAYQKCTSRKFTDMLPRFCTMLYAFEIPNITYYIAHQTAYIFAYIPSSHSHFPTYKHFVFW